MSSSCLTLSATNLDISAAGLDPAMCTNVKLTGSLSVSGTWTANANGTYTDGTTTTGTTQIELPAGCLNLSGTKVTLRRDLRTARRAGLRRRHLRARREGGGCTCTGTIQHAGLARARCPSIRRRAATTRRRATCSPPTRPAGEVRVLRLGKHDDLDAAEPEPDHVGHDRVREEQRPAPAARPAPAGTTGTAGTTGHAGTTGRRPARPARRGRTRRGGHDRRSRDAGGAAARAARRVAPDGAAAAGPPERRAARARRGRAARAASTDPAISTRPPTRRARRRTAWFGRSRRRTRARSTRSGAGARP